MTGKDPEEYAISPFSFHYVGGNFMRIRIQEAVEEEWEEPRVRSTAAVWVELEGAPLPCSTHRV